MLHVNSISIKQENFNCTQKKMYMWTTPQMFMYTALIIYIYTCLQLCCAVLSRSVVSNSETPWTAACQAPLSMGILQERILERVAMPSSSRGSSQPRDQTQASCTAGRFFTVWATGEAQLHIYKHSIHTHMDLYKYLYINRFYILMYIVRIIRYFKDAIKYFL